MSRDPLSVLNDVADCIHSPGEGMLSITHDTLREFLEVIEQVEALRYAADCALDYKDENYVPNMTFDRLEKALAPFGVAACGAVG